MPTYKPPRTRTVAERGYNPYTAKKYNFNDSTKNTPDYLQTLILDDDDCAMACDNEPRCKSFQRWENKLASNRKFCILYKKPGAEITNTTPDEPRMTNVRHFDKPTTRDTLSKTRLFVKQKDMSVDPAPKGYVGFDPLILDDGGKFTVLQNACQFANRNECDIGDAPSGHLVAVGGHYGTGKDGLLAYHTGVKACSIPGVVTNTIPTNVNGDQDPQALCPTEEKCDGKDVAVYCGYNTIDNDWIADNWDSINDDTFANTRFNSYIAPTRRERDGSQSRQEGLFQVKSSNLVKWDYCNTVSFNSFVSDTDTRPLNRCKNWVTQNNYDNPDSWNKHILDRASNEPWFGPDVSVKVPGMISSLCTDTNYSSCAGAIKNAHTDETWNPQTINSFNTMMSKSTQADVINSIHDKVEEYCQTREGNDECKCRNAIYYGINNCKDGIKGCEDIMAYQKLAQNVTEQAALNKIITDLSPEKLSAACKAAETVGTNPDVEPVLRYQKTEGLNVNLNACVQSLVNQGILDVNQINQKCYNLTTAVTGGKSGAAAGGGGGDGSDGTPSSGSGSLLIWILVAAFVFIAFSGLGGLALFATS